MTGTREVNEMFNGILQKKSLKLEKKIRKENCVGNDTFGLKISQPRQECEKKTRVSRIRVSLAKVDL